MLICAPRAPVLFGVGGCVVAQVVSRDSVFVAGGQPSITYVDRKQLDIEEDLARALAAPNQIVSLAGPSKSGKTVLCRHVLGKRQYVWVDGGQITTAKAAWDKVSHELNFPVETTKGLGSKTGITGKIKGLIFSAGGSQFFEVESKRKFIIDSVADAQRHLVKNNIALIVDDFHYLSEEARKELIRNVKSAIFGGLHVVLLSISHRIFDAIKAEPELTGRFASVEVPPWSTDDLAKIPAKGFPALGVNCPAKIADTLANECQNSPFLMQKFCWHICYDLGVEFPSKRTIKMSPDFDLQKIFVRIAKDSGLPIFKRLVVGPQIRKDRQMRPLRRGGEVDVYEATLLAIAEAGPPARISYNEIRASLNNVLKADVPQKHEVTSVLKQLSKISHEIGPDAGVDWDDDTRHLDISDPYLRFYLRWQVAKNRKV